MTADADSILSIGVVDRNGVLAIFSSGGPTADGRMKPEVLAPGVKVYAASFLSENQYERVDGTSFSTPLEAGVAALILENHPHWGPMKLREALMMTANRAENPDNEFGWGIINALQAAFYRSIGGKVIGSVSQTPIEDVTIDYIGPVSGSTKTNANGRQKDCPAEYTCTILKRTISLKQGN